MSQPPAIPDQDLPLLDVPPRHGYQGDRGSQAPRQLLPRGLTIALSREAGARGGTIARRAARELGWAVYDQELLEYMAQEPLAREEVFEGLSPEANEWVETHLHRLRQTHDLSTQPLMIHLARMVLALAVNGEAVLIGRGAGCILPRESTLHVRVVAPLEDRIAYMSQWLRLTREEAAERVRQRDERRANYVRTHLKRNVGDIHQYDLILNSTLLGEDGCADLLVHAAQVRSLHRSPTTE
jgi:cytidylate kinase